MIGLCSKLSGAVLAGLLWAGPPTPAEPSQPEPPSEAAPEQPTNDSPLTVTTRLTPDPSHIGDLLTLEVIVAFPKDHSVNLPNGLDFSPLELVGIEEGEVESTGSTLSQRFTITLQHFDVGEARVPSFPVTWIDPNDAVHTHQVAPHRFVVESLLANESEPQVQGEDPPISLEYPDERLALILYSVAAGLTLAAGLLVLWRTWARRAKPIVLPPPVPAHERALADLQQLASERELLLTRGQAQDYYVRLTEIAKRYLEQRFGIDALDSTTEEIRALLRREGRRIHPLEPAALLRMLEDFDLVKFARLSPGEDEAQAALHEVRELVERSRPDRVDASASEAVTPPDERARAQRPDLVGPTKPLPSEPASSDSSEEGGA